jgi:hypothetical protein
MRFYHRIGGAPSTADMARVGCFRAIDEKGKTMLDDPIFGASLAAARLLLQRLDARPDMARHERLATATYIVLDAFRQLAVQPERLPIARSSKEDRTGGGGK